MARTKEEATTSDATPRGRGRPRRSSDGVRKGYVPTGRPRGRPKSDNPKPKTYVPTGRPRGRPKGSGKRTGDAAAAEAAPAKSKAATPKAVAASKRGRPRKSDAADATPKRKGKHGRSSKKSLGADPEPRAADDVDVDVVDYDQGADAVTPENLAVESGECPATGVGPR